MKRQLVIIIGLITIWSEITMGAKVEGNGMNIEQLERALKFGEISHLQQHVFRLFLKYKPDLSKQSKQYKIFKQKLGKVAQHNKNPNRSWTAGINKFSFIEDSELRKQLLASQNCSATAQATLKREKKDRYKSLGIAPLSIDWRDKGVVSAV